MDIFHLVRASSGINKKKLLMNQIIIYSEYVNFKWGRLRTELPRKYRIGLKYLPCSEVTPRIRGLISEN